MTLEQANIPAYATEKNVQVTSNIDDNVHVIFQENTNDKRFGDFRMIQPISAHGLNLNRGSHKLLVDRPYPSQIGGLIPSVQNRNHFANPLEVALEHLFQIVATTAALFNQDSVLIVGEEAHEEVAGANQVFLKRSQSAPHLHTSFCGRIGLLQCVCVQKTGGLKLEIPILR